MEMDHPTTADYAFANASRANDRLADHEQRLKKLEQALAALGASFESPPEALQARIRDLPAGSIVAADSVVFIAESGPSKFDRWRHGSAFYSDRTVADTYGARVLRIGPR